MANTNVMTELLPVIERHWGYRTLRPLQAEAMQAALTGRDSLVVMPTGGGKSLCYQAPAVLQGGTTVVVSPLIALMKDQIDFLRSRGIAAARLDSSLTPRAKTPPRYGGPGGADLHHFHHGILEGGWGPGDPAGGQLPAIHTRRLP